jgi:hypothetical protein
MEKKKVWAKLISNNSQLKSRDESNDLNFTMIRNVIYNDELIKFNEF